MKSVRIIQQLASDAVRWQKEMKHALQQPQYSSHINLNSCMVRLRLFFGLRRSFVEL